MNKANDKTSTNHAAPAASTPPPRRVRRTDAALTPATPLEIIVSRALDQELEWYFVYAETALRREKLGLVPSHLAASALSGAPNENTLRAKAYELASTVQGCLRVVADCHASVLRAVYTPRGWPRNVEAEFQSLAPIVVRLCVGSDPWPARSAHVGLEEAAATRLSARMRATKSVALVRLKTRLREQASRLFQSALMAYTKVRALEGPALSLS